MQILSQYKTEEDWICRLVYHCRYSRILEIACKCRRPSGFREHSAEVVCVISVSFGSSGTNLKVTFIG